MAKAFGTSAVVGIAAASAIAAGTFGYQKGSHAERSKHTDDFVEFTVGDSLHQAVSARIGDHKVSFTNVDDLVDLASEMHMKNVGTDANPAYDLVTRSKTIESSMPFSVNMEPQRRTNEYGIVQASWYVVRLTPQR